MILKIKHKKDLITIFVIASILNYGYHIVTQMTFSYNLLVYVPLFFIYFLLYSLTRESILKSSSIIPAISFLAWSTTFPFLNGFTYEKIMKFAGAMNDYYFGIFTFAFLIVLQKVLISKNQDHKFYTLKAIGLTILNFIILLIPIVCWVYFLKYKVPMDVHGTFAIYQTNFSEAMEYLQGNFADSPFVSMVGVLLFVIAFYLFYRLNKKAMANGELLDGKKVKIIGIFMFLLLLCLVFFYKTGIVHFVRGFYANTAILSNYKQMHKELYDQITVNKSDSSIEKTPGTIIIVIGESATRDRMKVYNKNVMYDNTPWLSKERENKDFYIFNNGYSAVPSTVGVLQLALTKANVYNKEQSVESPNIFDIANKLGYNTVVASNQTPNGSGDSVIVQTMRNAKDVKYVEQDFSSGMHTYDESVMDLLKQVKPGNNFIVIHLMGSHFYYDRRFPPEFNKFPQEQHGIYANTLLYTDHVLQQIYDYSKKNLNLQAMVYFSDHGEDMKLTHNVATFKYNMTRIPFFVYLSPDYQKAYPETADILAARRNAYFTNDLMYDLIVGLLHANGNAYTPEDDFSSKQYKYNEHNLLTNNGQHYLVEDPYYNTNDVPID